MLLITGSNGQLGFELKRIYSEQDAIFSTQENLPTAHLEKLSLFFEQNTITAIINCAAYTQVDKAESDQENCYALNDRAVENLSQMSAKYQIPLIHISTDYVFNGKNYIPYKEVDETNPSSIYGLSKKSGEDKFLQYAFSGCIIRTSWLYSSHGKNFVKTMMNLGSTKKSISVVCDQVGTPTYAYDLACAIKKILPQIQKNEKEIYHFSNEGVASWYDFAYEIMKLKKLQCKITPIETKDYPTPARRPHYSVLAKNKIKNRFGIEVRHWREGLEECLQKIS
jgi:dTDP-4-dehydrorhamnose reductase